jgi:hypothetical protein
MASSLAAAEAESRAPRLRDGLGGGGAVLAAVSRALSSRATTDGPAASLGCPPSPILRDAAGPKSRPLASTADPSAAAGTAAAPSPIKPAPVSAAMRRFHAQV